LEYYQLLRSVLRTQPGLRRCLSRCRHCRIFFITHPRNAGRQDLGCPFGCQAAHSKQQSTRRSVEFYRQHKEKKRTQNGKRRAVGSAKPGQKVPQERAPGAGAVDPPWPEPLVEHVRVVVSLIERRSVSRPEILQMLARVLRQQGMGRRRKIDQTVAWLKEHPP
jgi:hypothetical protein